MTTARRQHHTTASRKTTHRHRQQELLKLPLPVTACACLLLVMAMTLLAACSHGRGDSDEDARKQRLTTLDDSITHHAPSALQLIEQGMKEADDSIAYYELLMLKAKYFMLSDTPDSLTPYVNRTLRFAKQQKPSPRLNSIMASAYSCAAIKMHNFHQNPDSVIALYKRSYQLLMNSDNKAQAHKLCGNLADAFYFKDNLPEAAAWYRRALLLTDSLKLPKTENVTLYLGLARIYMNLNDFTTSRRYYEQTAQQYNAMQPSMQAYFLNDYGSFFYYSKDYKSSLKKFLQLEQMLVKNRMENNFDMYLCRLNLADVYLNLGDVKESKRCLGMVEHYILRMNDPVATYYVNTIKIGIALRQDNISEVTRLLNSEHITADPGYNLRHIRNSYLRRYYARTGNFEKAYRLLREDDKQTDSLMHNRSNMRAYEIMDRFTEDTLRLHHSLEMEHKNADIYRTKSALSIMMLVAVVLVLLLIMWFMYARKQFLRNRISIMQLKLASARNRINPHFVFNVLNNKIMNDGAEASSELLELSRLIRTNLDMSTRMTVSLADELAFVTRYVGMQKYLLGPDFEFNACLAPDIKPDNIQVPSMFLQILAENAIVHGLKGREGKKTLTISVTHADNATTIKVEDNGRGFDARAQAPRKRTGLGVITQSIAALNEHSKRKLRFSLHNITSNDGTVCGCASTIIIPDGMKLE